jgi:hypothetical protein
MEISRFINFKDRLPYVVGSLVLLTLIGYFLHWLGHVIYTYKATPIFIKNSPEPIIVIAFLTYLVVLFFLVKALIKEARIFILHLSHKVYKFNSEDWPDKWIFSGKPESEAISELSAKSSRAGCLLKNHYWKDFRMTFEMKFINNLDPKVGIIFRAEDLDNYFMLELSNKDKEIRPHVRYHGGWDVIHPNPKTQAFDNPDYMNIVLEVKKSTAYLYANGHLELTWKLPTHVDVMYRESGSKEKEKSDPDEKYVQEIPFRSRAGMIGFRAHPGQGATIRGLTVEPF